MRHGNGRTDGKFLATMTVACLIMSAVAIAMADRGWIELDPADALSAGVAFDAAARPDIVAAASAHLTK
jgi:hypothetical protein